MGIKNTYFVKYETDNCLIGLISLIGLIGLNKIERSQLSAVGNQLKRKNQSRNHEILKTRNENYRTQINRPALARLHCKLIENSTVIQNLYFK